MRDFLLRLGGERFRERFVDFVCLGIFSKDKADNNSKVANRVDFMKPIKKI